MASRSARARAMRTAVAVAAVAAPLAAAGSAQAAIAGAAPASTTSYPDLVSATATSATTIQACYDKALSSVASGNSNKFVVSNYLSGDTLAAFNKGIKPYNAQIDGTNKQCVNLSFAPLPNNQFDLGQGTVVTDLGGAANTDGTAATNSLGDSVTLASSTTNSGTVGHTAGPDLTSVKITQNYAAPAAVGAAATPLVMAYTFDQNVDPNNVTVADYGYEDSTGNKYTASGGSYTVSGTTVTVTYPTTITPTSPTGTAGSSGAPAAPTVAYVTSTPNTATGAQPFNGNAAAYSANDGTPADEVANQPGSFDVNGASSVPTLAAASLNPAAPTTGPASTFPTANQAYSTVTYVFDHNTGLTSSNVGNNASGYQVALSDGTDLTDGVIQSVSGGGNVVTVAFPDLSAVAEYAVQAVVTGVNTAPTTGTGSAGTATTTGETPSNAGIGGNAGALARGYTTGPDVQKVVSEGTNSNGASQFLVYLDQRVDQSRTNLADITLLNAAGKVIGTASGAQYPSTNGAAAPGQQLVLLTFSNGGTFFTPTTGSPTQIAFENTAANSTTGAPANASFSTFLNSNGSSTTAGTTPTSSNGTTTYSGSQGPDANAVSVPQIVSLTSAAAHAKAIKHHVAKHHVAKKHVAKKHTR